MKLATITITVNIATKDEWEGNAKFELNIPENDLQDNPKNTWRKLQAGFEKAFENAHLDYYEVNA